MVVTDFHFIEITVVLTETDPVLIVNAYAVLPLPIAMQQFQSIIGRYPQIVQTFSIIDHHQFSQRDPLDGCVEFF